MKKTFLTVCIVLVAGMCMSQGVYLKCAMKMDKRDLGQIGLDTVVMYFQDGNSKTEDIPPIGTANSVLRLKSEAGHIYELDESRKTYIAKLDTPAAAHAASDYTIKVLGKEMTNGYNTTHVKVKTKDAGYQQELWLSTDIPGYESMNSAVANASPWGALISVLKAKGVNGFPVRIVTTPSDDSFSTIMDIIKAETRTLSDSIFSLKGYAELKPMSSVSSSEESPAFIKAIEHMPPQQKQHWMDSIKGLK